MCAADEPRVKHRFEIIRSKMIAENAPILKKQLKISGKDLAEMGFESEAISAALEKLWRNPAYNNAEWLTKMAQRLPKVIKQEPKDVKSKA